MSFDSTVEFHSLAKQLRADGIPFVLATVVKVHGSASARPGSKAIFDQKGKTLHGWIGGGCAEKFVAQQAQEALHDMQTRIVTANLDDEIFGLGVVCGGKMDVFVDPIFPAEKVDMSVGPFLEVAQKLFDILSWQGEWSTGPSEVQSEADLILLACERIAKKRGQKGISLRLLKELPIRFDAGAPVIYSHRVCLVGDTKVTEALAPILSIAGYEVLFVDHDANFEKGDVVVVAAHSAKDPLVVAQALLQKASHVAMIGSRTRALDVLSYLAARRIEGLESLYIPAGLEMSASSPEEIALSIAAEIIQESRRRQCM